MDRKLQRSKPYHVSVLARPHTSPIICARAPLAPRCLQTWPITCSRSKLHQGDITAHREDRSLLLRPQTFAYNQDNWVHLCV